MIGRHQVQPPPTDEEKKQGYCIRQFANCQQRFICTICGKHYTTTYNMRQHQNVHSGSGLHTCRYCRRDFTHKHVWEVRRKDYFNFIIIIIELDVPIPIYFGLFSSTSVFLWKGSNTLNIFKTLFGKCANFKLRLSALLTKSETNLSNLLGNIPSTKESFEYLRRQIKKNLGVSFSLISFIPEKYVDWTGVS